MYVLPNVTMDNIFKNIYFNPNDSGSLGGVYNLYASAKKLNPNITLNHVRDWLKKQNVYTLHFPARRRWKRNKIYVSYIDEQWEIDLIDLKIFANQNNGYNYILMVIDVFSKYLFAIPTKTKTAIEILNKFEQLFKTRKPTKIRSDRGGEFDNRIFKEFCEKNNVKFFTTWNKDIKCAVVERVNRTIKNKMFRYFTFKGTRRYIDILPAIINSYNNTIHRSIKMSPADVDIEHENYVYNNLYGDEKKIIGKIKFKPGDNVIIKYDLNPLDKSYYPLWKDRVYKINRVLRKYNKPLYVIHNGESELQRRYYPEELQKVSIDSKTRWLIEKIIAYRTVNGVRQALVKWKGYPESHNQWIPKTEIENL